MVKQTSNIESIKKFVFKGLETTKKKGVNAYIYYRVSSLKQEQDGKSLEWQKELCDEYCQKKGFTVVEYFGGKHESAKTDEGRKEFMRMIEAIRKGKPKVNHIVVYSYDRFSRSGDTSVMNELRELGVKIHAVTQPVDDDTPSGRFFQSMHVGYAAWENAERETKCKEGMVAKLKKGEVVTKPPIGYDKQKMVGEKKKQCVINDTGLLIRQAFYWAAEENVSQTEIMLRLENMGLKFSLSQLSRIFRNVFYIGYIKNSLLEGELVKGKHEPLVSEEIFMKVNGLLDQNSRTWKVNKENDDLPLKGFCKCSQCNGSLTGYFANGYWYYKCKKTSCRLNLSAEKINKLFLCILEQFKINPALIPSVQKLLEEVYWKLNENDLRRVKPLKDEITKLNKELETLEENLAFGRGVTKELYNKYFAKHTGRISQIEKELAQMTHEGSKLDDFLKMALEGANNLLKIWQLLDYRGKQRLQYLVFPKGILYSKEKRQVLTPEINKIFASIDDIARVLEVQGITDSDEKERLLQQL